MSKVKKIVAFTMAMIITVSFLLVGNTVSAVQQATALYSSTKEFFPDSTVYNNSYAYAYISNRGPNEENTDLKASTYVRNIYWWEDNIGNTTEVGRM